MECLVAVTSLEGETWQINASLVSLPEVPSLCNVANVLVASFCCKKVMLCSDCIKGLRHLFAKHFHELSPSIDI